MSWMSKDVWHNAWRMADARQLFSEWINIHILPQYRQINALTILDNNPIVEIKYLREFGGLTLGINSRFKWRVLTSNINTNNNYTRHLQNILQFAGHSYALSHLHHIVTLKDMILLADRGIDKQCRKMSQ